MKKETLYFKALQEANKKDSDKRYVKKLLCEAIELGSPDAAYALATWYLFGESGIIKKNFKKGFKLLKEAADKDHKEACYDIAICYETGKGIEKNYRKAFQFYLKAFLLGETQSIYEIGRCFYYGIGISKNKTVANIWLSRAKQLNINS